MANPLSLNNAPPRPTPLGILDLLAGFASLMAGVVLFSLIVRRFVPVQDGQLAYASALQQAAVGALGVVLTTGLTAGYFALRTASAGWSGVGLTPRRPGRDVAMGLGALVVVVPMVFAVSMVVTNVAQALGYPSPELAHAALREMVDSPDPRATWLLIATAVVLAPVLEEMVYRGLVQGVLLGQLGDKRRWAVVAISAAAFASIHTAAVSWQSLPALFVLGLGLGFLYERTASLWPGVVLHAGFNAVNIAIALAVIGAGKG